MTDLVAIWEVDLSDGVHKIEFEHGTATGKRVIYVDGKEIMRKEWMFKLVGKETFTVGASKTKASINIDAVSGFAYEYTLEIDGKSLKKYMENRSKTTNTWMVHLDGTLFRVVLEKDTMDVWCNGKKVETAEILRKKWMFKLVGKETFTVGASKTKATINIDAVSDFAYEYTLEIDGKSLNEYMENRSKTTNTWVLNLDGTIFRVVLEKDTMDVWCNGQKVKTTGEFVEDGTETHFNIGNHNCCIKAVSSGKRKEGILHTLLVDDGEIPEALQ